MSVPPGVTNSMSPVGGCDRIDRLDSPRSQEPTLVPSKVRQRGKSGPRHPRPYLTDCWEQSCRPAFPLLVCLFIFILTQNGSGSFSASAPCLCVTTKANGWSWCVLQCRMLPVALALVSTAGWLYFIMRYARSQTGIPGPVWQQGPTEKKSGCDLLLSILCFFCGRHHRSHLNRFPPGFALVFDYSATCSAVKTSFTRCPVSHAGGSRFRSTSWKF